jgi:GTP-binding protein HflX
MDASAPDRERRAAAVHTVLAEVGAARVPLVDVLNKIDAVLPADRAALAASHPDAFFVSAATGEGQSTLLEAIASRLSMDAARVHLEFDTSRPADRKLVSDLYRHARVIAHTADEDRVSIEADVPRRLLARFARAKVPA